MTDTIQATALERRVSRRLLAVLMPAMLVAFIDRLNVSFAAPTMNPALGIDAATFGLGAGIFFLGYLLFEVPSNIILSRVGARWWISRIMVTWGLVAMGMALVRGPDSFLVMRFLLGVAEAGFIPGAMLYASYWVSTRRLGEFNAWLLLMVPIAGSVTALLSAAILSLDGFLGVAGWQWIFLLQGFPAVALGFVCFTFLDNGPRDAKWLTDEEKRMVETMTGGGGRTQHASVRTALLTAGRNRTLWVLACAYFLMNLALGAQPWFPLMLAATGLDSGEIALAVAVPNLLAAAAMVVWGKRSDRSGERANHLLGSGVVSAVGWIICAMASDSAIGTAVGITLALVGLFASVSVLWAVPAASLSAADRPVGIALITCIGLLGSFISPVITGEMKVMTGSYDAGMCMAAAGILLAVVLAGSVARRMGQAGSE